MKRIPALVLIFIIASTNFAFAGVSEDTATPFRDIDRSIKFSVTQLNEKIENLDDITIPSNIYIKPTSFWEGRTGAKINFLKAPSGLFFEIKRYTLDDQNNLILDSDFSPDVQGKINAMYPDPSGEKDINGFQKTIFEEIDGSEMDKYAVQFSVPTLDTTYTLEESGYYYIDYRIEGLDGGISTMLKLENKEISETEVKNTVDETVQAIPTNSKILVNGNNQPFEAYLINDNNYFKLRDIALAVNDTNKNFEINWDASNRAINLISNTPYTIVGGELTPGDGVKKSGIKTNATIYKDANTIDLLGYNINGNNFFKLRDVAEVFNIGITWDGETKTVGIDTGINYLE